MAESNSYLLRGDDGTMYRLTKDQLEAHKLGANDPAHKKSAAFAQAHEAAKKGSVSPDFWCMFAARESSGPAKR